MEIEKVQGTSLKEHYYNKFENVECSFCGEPNIERFIKRNWVGDHNEYVCICKECINKFNTL